MCGASISTGKCSRKKEGNEKIRTRTAEAERFGGGTGRRGKGDQQLGQPKRMCAYGKRNKKHTEGSRQNAQCCWIIRRTKTEEPKNNTE